MDLGLAGRTAVVTGASRGSGVAPTRGRAAEGAPAAAGARRSPAELNQLAKEGSVRVLEVALAAPGGPDRLVALAGAGPDILVKNVGGAPARTGGFLSISDEEWQGPLPPNLMAAGRAPRRPPPPLPTAGEGAARPLLSAHPSPSDPRALDLPRAQGA